MFADGYYVSAYCCISEIGYVLKAQIRHDQAIALWKLSGNKLDLVRYWELERLTRQKQHMQPFVSKEHFLYVLEYLLQEENVALEEIQGIFGMPEFDCMSAGVSFAKEKHIPVHSLGHMFSALIDTRKTRKANQLILAVDGGPDNLLDNGFDLPHHYLAGVFKEGQLKAVSPVSSPAYMWTEASDMFRMREGTLMALAEACTCTTKADIGQIKLDSFMSMWEIPVLRAELNRVWDLICSSELVLDDRFSLSENRISCFMKLIQQASIRMMIQEIRRILASSDLKPENTYLSVTGGFALNCPTNTAIMRLFPFMEFISPPCVNDSGMAMGLGLMAFYFEIGDRLDFTLNDAYYGYKEADSILNSKYASYIESVQPFDMDTFIRDIETAPVCWFEEAAEIGPRALGHRSLLASAVSTEMKDALNRIKQREWWRPVAPIVLADVVQDWITPAIKSPFMLHTVEVKEEYRDIAPAIMHLNYSARIQTIDTMHSFHPILQAYYEKTGVPVICNTSLNDKGEPIINTYDELLNFSLRKHIHVIYVEQKRYTLYNFSAFDQTVPEKGSNPFDCFVDPMREELAQKYVGICLDEETLDFYVNHVAYFDGVELASTAFFDRLNQVRGENQ